MDAAAANLKIIETYSRPLEVRYRSTVTRTIFQRLNDDDRTAVGDCIRIYGNELWRFAGEHTHTVEDSSILASEIFQDIWEFGELRGNTPEPEDLLIKKIAIRRLYKHKWDGLQHKIKR